MGKYRVNLCTTYIVTAEDECEAVEKAYDLLSDELGISSRVAGEIFANIAEQIS